MRFAYAISVSTSGAGELVLQVHAPNAQLVEVDGDLTSWQPQAMQRQAPGRFRASFPAPDGLARIRLRIDGGAWIAPPGLASVPDETGGVLGVIPGR